MCLLNLYKFLLFPDIDITNIRIPGVLQRFAVTYLIVGVMHMLSARPADPHQVKKSSFLFLFSKYTKLFCLSPKWNIFINTSHSFLYFLYTVLYLPHKMKLDFQTFVTIWQYMQNKIIFASHVLHILNIYNSFQFVWWTSIQEIVIYWPDWVVSVVLLVIYIAVTFGVYISPCGR